ncbi:MAG: UDP-N-acetylmuramoyl-L-alanyl-D-glutamate--2,6-diaminopimelate ligase [Betaproteobacteria bacterium]
MIATSQPARPALAPAAVLAQLALSGAPPIHRITSDSRNVAPGDAFAAYPGAACDGRAFIPDALQRGAGSVLWETTGYTWPTSLRAPNAGIDNLKHELGFIADHVYTHPSERLWMVGVTGTNGKTSCAHWIAHALDASGRRAAVAGTLGNGFPGAIEPGVNTTPDAAALQELLNKWANAGAQAVAMEVSSHGLTQGRVNGVHFDVALFTNLTRDHLDYHGSMEAYGEAKARLFDWPALQSAVINADDAFGLELIARCRRRGVPVLSYGRTGGDIHPVALEIGVDGIAATVDTPQGRAQFRTGVVGDFNASNLLGVLGVLLASDIDLSAAAQRLEALRPVAGRMQKTGGHGQPLVVVDYAHTPDALEKALRALRPVAASRSGALSVVFGCGGDRDPGKRPQMGAIAAEFADSVFVTSDNPRSEDPAAILAAIVAGIATTTKRIDVLVGRDQAIAAAIAEAGSADVVLVAGKGHEPYQEIAGVRHPFSDLDHANSALARRSAR